MRSVLIIVATILLMVIIIFGFAVVITWAVDLGENVKQMKLNFDKISNQLDQIEKTFKEEMQILDTKLDKMER